ncbi:MAG: transcriptional regulator GcvA [Alphaproteobacteria bacterium]|nr:transcriptional regulator GcvA [Alphaproteobacteria bacterium]MCW5741140.1 transcriptional regulator GcvA [Alphaproteobacteria bacterium]
MRITLSRLPPLNSLRAFVVAAKHMSFSRAANELHVTPAAVSQQIRQLEDYLGVELFKRSNRNLLLTAEGQSCLPGLTEAFDGIVQALQQISAGGKAGPLTVSVAPSFAAKWLVPRLDDFRNAQPEIDVRITASMNLVDFDADDIDCAIRYGSGNYAPLFHEKILEEMVFPVCSPSLEVIGRLPATPDDLRQLTLLHDDSPDQDPSCPDWRMWLRAAGVSGIDSSRGVRFNQSSLVLEAAIAGQGVALAKGRLAADDIRAGRLIRPFNVSHALDFAYHFVCPTRKTALPKVAAFLAWLRAQAGGEAAIDSTAKATAP